MGATGFQYRAERGRFAHEALDIDRHTGRPVRLQFGQAVTELRDGSLPVAAPPVVKANPDLQDPLVEVAHVVRFMDPDALERLVLLEELLPVELLDAVQQGIGWRVVAACRPAGGGFLDGRLHADAWP